MLRSVYWPIMMLAASLSHGLFEGLPAQADDWASILVTPPTDSRSWDPGRFVPSPRQLAYQEGQLGVFVHFGLATYAASDTEYHEALHPTSSSRVLDGSRFNPTLLDAEQWVLTAKAMGARHLVITAKHHEGFCLWPTKTTDHSVRNSPWKSGKGDVVRELADACRKHGLSLGLYCSPADISQGCWADPANHYALVGDRDAYFHVYQEQLRELLTNYGEVVTVWFDTYCDPFCHRVTDGNGKPMSAAPYETAIVAMVRSLQPRAVIIHWGTALTDVRAVGNEDGTAPYPVWNAIRNGEGAKFPELAADAEGWYLHESDIPTRKEWFWRPNTDDQVLSVDRLAKVYYDTIGVGANVLANLTPDPRGLIPDADVRRIGEYAVEMHRRLGTPVARVDSTAGWTTPGMLELDLGRTASVRHVVLEEAIAFGQHVLQYSIEAKTGDQWTPIAQGESIGRKRIHRFDPAISAEKLRLRVVKADAVPIVREMAAYDAP